MPRRVRPYLAKALWSIALGAWLTLPASGQSGAKNGEWRYYGGDAGGTKYSPLDRINRDNVKDLRIVWRWKAENFGPRPDFNYEATPLLIGGVLYTTAGSRRDVVAVDGATAKPCGCSVTTKAYARKWRRPGRPPAAASRTGPTARGMIASSS